LGSTPTEIMQIIHSKGICRRKIQYCECPNAPPSYVQLLEHGLFPATYKRPQTAFTFEVLDQFHIDAMECKTSAGSFYSKLRRMTSNSFPDSSAVSETFSNYSCTLTRYFSMGWQDRYRELMRVSRQWRDLMNRKRFGYGHDQDKKPSLGDLALFCPACPQPGINIPDDWKSLPEQ
jgi:CxC2 like cysteine cluster associated with KDZ transposases